MPRQRRLARTSDLDVKRQQHRQVFVLDRLYTARSAMHHRDRSAPIALPGDAPVLQPISCFGRSSRPGAHQLASLVSRHACILSRVDQDVVSNNLEYRDAVLGAELKIPLVVRRHRHDCARSVAHQNKIANPNRHLLTAERIDRKALCCEAILVDVARILAALVIHHRLQTPLSSSADQAARQRMLRCQD